MREIMPLPDEAPLRTADRVALVLLGFFILIAFTLELLWLQFHGELVALAPTHWWAHMFQIYGAADRAYYDAVTPLSLTLEGINVYFTQALNVLLIYAIVKRRPYRHALQLTIGAYLSYSVTLYFLQMQVGGFVEMGARTPSAYALFYVTNLPWLAGHLYLAYDSFVVITRRFR